MDMVVSIVPSKSLGLRKFTPPQETKQVYVSEVPVSVSEILCHRGTDVSPLPCPRGLLKPFFLVHRINEIITTSLSGRALDEHTCKSWYSYQVVTAQSLLSGVEIILTLRGKITFLFLTTITRLMRGGGGRSVCTLRSKSRDMDIPDHSYFHGIRCDGRPFARYDAKHGMGRILSADRRTSRTDVFGAS
jgi:hypothetical protein